MASTSQRVAAFLRWWTGELRQLIPARLSTFAGGRIPTAHFEDGELVVVDGRPGGAAPARVAIDSLDAAGQRGALRQVLVAAGETRGRVRLALARDEVLVRRVWLPGATEENLEQVIGFEMDRLTPFRAEDVYFDHRVVGRDPVSGQLQVEVALARREVVDPKLERLRSWGGNVHGVLVATDGSAAALDLLPHGQRGQREGGRERWLVPGLALVVVALLAVALLLPVYKKREAVVALLPQVGQAKLEAEATDVVRAALEKQVADYNFVMTRKQGNWPVLAYVEEISRLLPDNTWVQQLDVKTIGKNREVQVTGETASASRLIDIFEQSTVLQNAAPKGSLTRGSTPGSERFMIVAEGKPRPLPATRPLLEVAEALPNAAPTTAAPAPAVAPAQAAAPSTPAATAPGVAPAQAGAQSPAKPPSTAQPPAPAKGGFGPKPR